mgnify:CR=1 FL=1
MNKITAVILDDEPLARKMLEEYLDDVYWIDLKASLGDPHEAIITINDLRPDLLFLDIEMPELNGFDVLEALTSDTIPNVIFSTAYDQYAIRAFEVNAIDYLLKPYTSDRFQSAIDKLKSSNIETQKLKERIQSLLKQVNEKSYPDQIYVRKRKSVQPVNVNDIIWIEADGDYSILHLEEETHLCSIGIGELVKQLDPEKIFRVHRSHAIAKPYIKELVPNGYGGFVSYMENGKELKISRHYADKIKSEMF